MDGHGREYRRLSRASELAARQPAASRSSASTARRTSSICFSATLRPAPPKRSSPKPTITGSTSATIFIFSRIASASCGPASAPASAISIFTIYSGKLLAQLTNGEWAVTEHGRLRPRRGHHAAWMKRTATSISFRIKKISRETQLYRVSLADKTSSRASPKTPERTRPSSPRTIRVHGHFFKRHDARAPGSLSHGWHARRRDQ